jgi:putative transcriptional regulator
MFRNRIGYWAQVKGFKHNYLAKECGVSIQTFSRWVNNHTQPDLEKAFILGRIFNIPVGELGDWEFQKED